MQDEHLVLLGQIDGKQDQILKRLSDTNKRVGKVAERVSTLEAWRNWMIGAAAAASMAIPLALEKLKGLFLHANN